MADLIAAPVGFPACRAVDRCTALTIRHAAGDQSAREAVHRLGLTWPDAPGTLTGADPWLAWRSPSEVIALGIETQRLTSLFDLLSPGRSESALAADIAEALAVFELDGPMLDEWLAHLVDSTSIPRQPGRATRARLADCVVMLLRVAPDRVWLLSDRPIMSYVQDWLAYSHEGAFGIAVDKLRR